MNCRSIIWGILIFMATINVVSAQSTETGFAISSECLDANTLREYVDMNISGSVTTIEVGNTYCPSGCVEGLSKYGADCKESQEVGFLRYDLLGMWAMIWVFLMWMWGRGWKRMVSSFMGINAFAGLLITTHPIMLTPIAVSILLMLWSWGIIKERGEQFS